MEKQTLSSQESREADLEAKISEIMFPLLELSSLDLDFADLVIKNVTIDYGSGNNPFVNLLIYHTINSLLRALEY